MTNVTCGLTAKKPGSALSPTLIIVYQTTLLCCDVWCCTVHIDISRVFNSVLPQQCQPADSFSGAPTICANYTKWYSHSHSYAQ